jgi:putative transposase
MPNYRRAFVPGGCFFFTVNLLERRQCLLTDQIDILREAVAPTRRHHSFAIDAFVVLPDHVHAVWTLPPEDRDFSVRWRLIKTRSARALPEQERRSDVRIARGKRGIWQRRFWEHLIRDEADYARHVECCYINSVKHGRVARVRDWSYSSFHRDVSMKSRTRLRTPDSIGSNQLSNSCADVSAASVAESSCVVGFFMA